MAKYLVLWELNTGTIPTDPAERGKLFGNLMQVVQQGMAEGMTTDWGIFPGASAGFSMHEGTEEQILGNSLKYSPFAKLEARPVLSAAEAVKVLQSMK